MAVDLSPREYRVRFVDGPFAGREAYVTALPPRPLALYVLADGGIVSPVEIVHGNPDAHALAGRAWSYAAANLAADSVQEYVLTRGPRA